MKLQVALAELKGVRVAVAFPPPGWVVPGIGDALLERLRPYFPTLPIMLASTGSDGVRAHAAFQAQALVEGCDLGELLRIDFDLDVPPAEPDVPPPF